MGIAFDSSYDVINSPSSPSSPRRSRERFFMVHARKICGAAQLAANTGGRRGHADALTYGLSLHPNVVVETLSHIASHGCGLAAVFRVCGFALEERTLRARVLAVSDGNADAMGGSDAVGGLSEINCSRAARRAIRNMFTEPAGHCFMCIMVLKYDGLLPSSAWMRVGVTLTIPM